MNDIIKRESEPKTMLMDFMADKAGLTVDEFSQTVRATCGLSKASAAEFAAFIMVARQYDLNPLLKEIYAFPAKGGGIVPIVSIDGWVNLVNSHGACDGFDFEVINNAKGELEAITCRMYRKDRKHPVVVTEYLSECVRATEPWKMKHRMLRHKAMIQAARYAFGFSGIYDEDEGNDISRGRDGQVMEDITPPSASEKPVEAIPPPSATQQPMSAKEALTASVAEAVKRGDYSKTQAGTFSAPPPSRSNDHATDIDHNGDEVPPHDADGVVIEDSPPSSAPAFEIDPAEVPSGDGDPEELLKWVRAMAAKTTSPADRAKLIRLVEPEVPKMFPSDRPALVSMLNLLRA